MKLDKFHWKFKEEYNMGKVLKDYRSLSANQKSMRRAIDNYKVVKKNNAQVNKKISTQPKRKLYLQMMENQKHE